MSEQIYKINDHLEVSTEPLGEDTVIYIEESGSQVGIPIQEWAKIMDWWYKNGAALWEVPTEIE